MSSKLEQVSRGSDIAMVYSSMMCGNAIKRLPRKHQLTSFRASAAEDKLSKKKLHSQLGDAFTFFQPLNRCVEERKTILIQKNLARTVFQNTLEDSQQDTIPPYKPEDNATLSLVHIALQIQAYIMSTHSHRGFFVSEDDAISCVPDSLYMFLRLIFGGQNVLADWNTDVDDNQTQTIATVAARTGPRSIWVWCVHCTKQHVQRTWLSCSTRQGTAYGTSKFC